ncbi:dienelactone hydrolase family protein [Legionella maioricensis]|uniref:Alpha/beta hydrolase n=1 Tax=Legionella maioricensis TaxID=2896528 RepID=A0A9X2D2Q0_9GAMM|nr:dienelactone hydrolase family protein [Legionella maioricensis]MCL9684960.1 alpha/beta hydrolase [Legionella maioricensis]MCL9688208.1 alpha/beta hydrolase [Legionella maioricensis]
MKNYAVDTEHTVVIPSSKSHLNGLLYIPKGTESMVLFVHGSGSSRLSTRNQYVAKALNTGNHATLLFDLLTPAEEVIDNLTRELRFDINLLATRLIDVTHWCIKEFPQLAIGYFGASTGGGAALVAAAQTPAIVKAVVSRGGRPDLAKEYLSRVKAPTLLIVGGHDEVVIELNQMAMSKMTCVTQLDIVPGATHLFEEPGTLEEVADLAKIWFDHYLVAGGMEHE